MIEWFNTEQTQAYAQPLAQRFALADNWLANHKMLRFGERRVYVAHKDVVVPDFADETTIEGLGISLLRVQNMAIPKPTFEGAGFLLPHANNNVLALTLDEAKMVRSTTDFVVADKRADFLSRGFILTHLDGVSYGCAHFRDGKVSSYFPKRYSHYNMVD